CFIKSLPCLILFIREKSAYEVRVGGGSRSLRADPKGGWWVAIIARRSEGRRQQGVQARGPASLLLLQPRSNAALPVARSIIATHHPSPTHPEISTRCGGWSSRTSAATGRGWRPACGTGRSGSATPSPWWPA